MSRSGAPIEAGKKVPQVWIWPLLVIGLLTIHAVTWLGFTLIAVSDPTFSVEPDHYQKSLRWDETAEERRQSEALGWTARVEVESAATPLGERRLACWLTDAGGVPISGAQVEVEIFHHARGEERVTRLLSDHGEGRYDGVLPMRRPGLWECRLRVRRGDATFVHVAHCEVEDDERRHP